MDLDLISGVDFGSDRSDLILRAGRRRLTPVTSNAMALTGNSPDFTSSAAMRVRAVSEGRGDAQQARGRTGRSGELALGCERWAARGKGRERGAGWALLGQARERASWVELGWTDRGSRLGRGWFVELGWVDFGSLGWFDSSLFLLLFPFLFYF